MNVSNPVARISQQSGQFDVANAHHRPGHGHGLYTFHTVSLKLDRHERSGFAAKRVAHIFNGGGGGINDDIVDRHEPVTDAHAIVKGISFKGGHYTNALVLQLLEAFAIFASGLVVFVELIVLGIHIFLVIVI